MSKSLEANYKKIDEEDNDVNLCSKEESDIDFEKLWRILGDKNHAN